MIGLEETELICGWERMPTWDCSISPQGRLNHLFISRMYPNGTSQLSKPNLFGSPMRSAITICIISLQVLSLLFSLPSQAEKNV